jgi:hypothetical protein
MAENVKRMEHGACLSHRFVSAKGLTFLSLFVVSLISCNACAVNKAPHKITTSSQTQQAYDETKNALAALKAEKAQEKAAAQAAAQAAAKTNMENKDESFGGAVMAPLEDLNLKRKDIPPILARASENTYELKGLDSCEAIAGEVVKLDAVLGDDFDEPPPPPDERSMMEKGGHEGKKYAYGAVRGAARDIIPFRSWVRIISGADKYKKAVDRAIKAGNNRRAFLKGLGMSRNCAPPAAPSWFKPKIYSDRTDRHSLRTRE